MNFSHFVEGTAHAPMGLAMLLQSRKHSLWMYQRAHEGVVVPLGTIPCAFSCKIALSNLVVLHEKSHDGGGIFDYALLSDFVGLPLIVLLLSIVPWRRGEFGRWLLGRLGGRIKLRELFSTVSRTLSKQTRRSLTISNRNVFDTCPANVGCVFPWHTGNLWKMSHQWLCAF